MTPTTTTPTTKKTDLKTILSSENMQRQFRAALPKHLSAERFSRIAITALTRTPKLAQCTQESFFKCLLDLSAMGLEPDGRRAHLIPYGQECTLILDYKGIVELVHRSGDVAVIHCDVVCANDEFEYGFGTGSKLVHKPNLRDRGEAFAVYSYVRLKDGSESFEVMSKAEVDAVRKRSRSAHNGPWVTDWNEMAKKGLALDTPIPTESGWTTMGEIAVGETVFDMHGRRTKVLAVSNIKNIPCFRVNFADGESIVCDDEHRWVARIEGVGRPKWPVYTINELFDAKSNGLSVSMPITESIELNEVQLPVDPWILGCWLGDGGLNTANITHDKDDVPHLVEAIGRTTLVLGKVRQDKRSRGCCVGIKKLKIALRELGVLSDKHIPAIYLRSSHNQRLALLRGLMDSDGHMTMCRGRAVFEQTNERMAMQVCELLASLGEKFFCNPYTRKGFGTTANTFRIEWQPVHCPVLLPRKAERFKERALGSYRGVASIERVESVPTRCIAVDSPTHTYLAGRTMVPTHNTAFRRHSKWLPLSPELRDKIETDDEPVGEQARFAAAKPVFSESAGQSASAAIESITAPAAHVEVEPQDRQEESVPVETVAQAEPVATAEADEHDVARGALGALLFQDDVSEPDFMKWAISGNHAPADAAGIKDMTTAKLRQVAKQWNQVRRVVKGGGQ